MSQSSWVELGPVETFTRQPLTAATVGVTRVVVTWVHGQFGVLAARCNHAGGPLADGTVDGEYVVCPWHHWKYHCRTGRGEPGFEADAVPQYAVMVQDGRLFASVEPVTRRTHGVHELHPLARPVSRAPGPLRVLALSTTNMDMTHPRPSTSDLLLAEAVQQATELGAETRLIRLAELSFRACEGYYSKAALACTWPCSITQMDATDQMERVYEHLVHWADVVLLATPIRWGSASALYFKMAERLNCVQNQVTIANRVLIRNKVAGFIITGGQDNVQGVAGQLLGFFAELGFHFPHFPYVAHSRGWSAEDMERNVEMVRDSQELRDGARALAIRALDHARLLLDHERSPHTTTRGGRKAHRLVMKELGR